MIINFSAKCSDLFYMQSGDMEYDGYVPDFFPEDHYGDYVTLSIDTKTGKILNWPKVSDAQVNACFTRGKK